jgi:hypothetical protein
VVVVQIRRYLHLSRPGRRPLTQASPRAHTAGRLDFGMLLRARAYHASPDEPTAAAQKKSPRRARHAAPQRGIWPLTPPRRSSLSPPSIGTSPLAPPISTIRRRPVAGEKGWGIGDWALFPLRDRRKLRATPFFSDLFCYNFTPTNISFQIG